MKLPNINLKPKLYAIHLLNDYSGSPLVFKQALESLSDLYDITLYTSNTEGFLSSINNIKYKPFTYSWSKFKWITLYNFILAHIILSIRIFLNAKSGDIIYINTLLPSLVSLVAKHKNCKVVFHIHETSIKPKVLMDLLLKVCVKTGDKFLFVSKYVSEQFEFPETKKFIIYNSLPLTFIKKALESIDKKDATEFTVSMLCSLKKYKGIYEFIEIAKKLPDINFVLVLNSNKEEVDNFIQQNSISANCKIISAIKDTVPIYIKSHLILNLSRPDEWVETFGMTVLEAMYFGIPVIVPQVGGVCELIDHRVNGFYINGSEYDTLIYTINQLKVTPELYNQFSNRARHKALDFNHEKFEKSLLECFTELN